MINKNLSDISIQDLEQLIKDEVCEGKTIEYKLMVNLDKEDAKKEFLCDVSSFVNTQGGDLIIGIREDKGIPVELVGMEINDPDKEIQRINDIIRSGLEPKVSHFNCDIRPLPLPEKKKIIIIRTKKSWSSPHRVSFKDHWKFYARNSSGKYALDITELKNAFILSELLAEKIERFRMERCFAIKSGNSPYLTNNGPKITLHIIPMSAFDHKPICQWEKVKGNPFKLPTLFEASSLSDRINLEGILTYYKDPDGSFSYVQLYRTGIIEAVDPMILSFGQQRSFIHYPYLKKRLPVVVQQYLNLLQSILVEPPFYLFISLIGVNNLSLMFDDYARMSSYPIDREDLLFPDVLIENYTQSMSEVLEPIFDLLLNSVGHIRN